jgi:hypothetical protein
MVQRFRAKGVEAGPERSSGNMNFRTRGCFGQVNDGGGERTIRESRQAAVPWHFLYFFPEPQGQGSFLPTFASRRFTGCVGSSDGAE